jgi:putative hydrolase of the HAD superfamily
VSIKAVTFDLWETLLFERDGDSNRRSQARYAHVAEAFNKFGIQVSREQVQSAMKQVINSLLKIWDRNEDVTHVEQLEALVRFVTNGSVEFRREWVEALSEAYVSPFFEIPPYLNPDARSALEYLVESGKGIGLICNTGLTPGFALRRFLDSEGVLGCFDFLAFSDEIGFRKPDYRIFHLVARKLKTDPNSVIHVGDNLRIDVWGAKSAGFRAICFACDEGRDKIAEADPNSLVARSRSLGTLEKDQIKPDKTISSLGEVKEAVEWLEEEM